MTDQLRHRILRRHLVGKFSCHVTQCGRSVADVQHERCCVTRCCQVSDFQGDAERNDATEFQYARTRYLKKRRFFKIEYL